LANLVLECGYEFNLPTYRHALATFRAPSVTAPQSYLSNFISSNVIQSDLDMLADQKTQKQAVAVTELPFLLVDVRDKECFMASRIVSSVHFNPMTLSRGTNQFSADLLHYKNKPDKVHSPFYGVD
jgi:hypothetical protein